MFYDKHVGMPKSGSWQEVLMVLVWRRRMDMRYDEARLLTQAIVTPKEVDNVNKALDDFADTIYPFRKRHEAQRKEQQQKALEKWVSQGPLYVQPLVATTGEMRQARLLRRGEAAKKERQKAVDAGELVRLSSKLWRERSGASPAAVRKARRRE